MFSIKAHQPTINSSSSYSKSSFIERFFALNVCSWTKSQVQARSHPNVLAATAWLNHLYHYKGEQTIEGVDLSTPLTYADRFRIRHPGGQWKAHPPHVDGLPRNHCAFLEHLG